MSATTRARFTPGPWAIYECDGETHVAPFTDKDGKEDCVAAILQRDELDDLMQADANLIAAAPDLYAALQGLVMAHHCEPDSRHCENDAEMRAARAALNKAEGI